MHTAGSTHEAPQSALDLLKAEGDWFEVLICSEKEHLDLVLLPYAEVWAHHLRSKRINGGAQLQPEWMPFGGSHYTALIRLHHAHRAKQKIMELCRHFQSVPNGNLKEGDYAVLLDIHAACAAFWENLGSTIDNLRCAFFEAMRVVGDKSIDWKRGKVCAECGQSLEPQFKTKAGPLRASDLPALYRAYQRRTQFIHSRLVTKVVDSGRVFFNAMDYSDENTKWPAEEVKPARLEEVLEQGWTEVLQELSSEWWTLHSWLQKHDKKSVAEGFTSFSTETKPLSTPGPISPEAFTHPISGSFNVSS